MEPAQIGRYELHAPLGRGGMGTVYKARDPLMERWVAVKTITVHDAHQRARFQQEVQAAGSLNHAHITTIYDVGEQGDLAYIVMELVEGDTLASRLARPVPWPEAVKLLLPICDALSYAHRKGVIHRDVKPANILISTEGKVKLTDFGVARLEAALRRITESGSTVGTPLYTAPEQIRNEPVDGRADLFSVGIVLFELVTSQHPFTAETLAQVIYRITQPEPASMALLAAMAPPILVEAVRRALSKEAAGRFGDAQAMATALVKCLEQPDAVVPVSPAAAEPLTSPPDRPILDPVSNILLSPTEEGLLRLAFPGHDRIYLEREFSSGYSGARVLLATPVRSGGRRLAQVVLKLATPGAIDKEWRAYQEYVKDTLPPVTARILEEPLLATEGQLALLRYSFAGGFGNTPPEALRTYYTQHSGDEVAALLDKSVFRAFGPKWWLQRKTTDLIIRREYDHLLPVHLVVEYRELAEVTATPRNLIARKTNAESCRQLTAGQLVQIEGFSVEEISPDEHELTLQALPPSGNPTNPIRVRVVGSFFSRAKYPVGQTIPALIGVVTATRHELLRQLAEPAFPGQNLDQKQLTVGGQAYLNPLYDYESLLDQRLTVMNSIIHGDLNLDNILVTPASGLAWLIDFATTREGHNLYDFMRLETQVITKLLSQTRAGPEAVAQLMVALHQVDPSPQTVPTELRKSFTVLVAIRHMVRICQYSRENWDEYYLGLVITLLGALKFKELDVRTRALTLTAAATVRGLIANPALRLTPLPVAPPTPVTPSSTARSKLAAGVIGLLVILALLTALAFWVMGTSPPAPTATPPPARSPTPMAAMVESQAKTRLNTPSALSTPTPLPTATPTPSPTLEPPPQPEVVPTEILVPTATPTPTMPTPTPTFTPSPTPCRAATYFGDLATGSPDLGCPLEAWLSDFTYQQFERGLMIWRKSPAPSKIFVLYDDGSWRSEIDPQGPRQPACPQAGQTGGKGPISSFGLIWCRQEMARLGLPLTGESAAEDSAVEEFEQGRAFRLAQTRYVLLADNSWRSLAEAVTQISKPEPTLASTDDNIVVLENFEGYNPTSLAQSYTRNTAWDKNELTLDVVTLADLPELGQVARLTHNIKATPPDHYVGMERNLAGPQDWSTAAAIQFWVRNEAGAVDLVFQWGERQARDGEVWQARLPLPLGESRQIELPLTAQYFSRTDWSTSGNGQLDLAGVDYYAFFIERAQPGQGTLYVDSLKLLLPRAEPPAPPVCQGQSAPEFAMLWQAYQTELGCPAGGFQILPFHVEETFAGGHLFWREDTNEVYLIYDRQKDGADLNNGNWELPPWKWDGVTGCNIGQSPPAGLRTPERGFGWLWCTHLGGPSGPLGWALTKEQGFNSVGRVQRFERGLAFQSADAKRYALLNNGRFLIEPPTPPQPPPPPPPTPEPPKFTPTGFETAPVFAQLWETLEQGDGPLGYPLGSAITDRNYACQLFEQGFMFWWESPQQPQPIWVIYTPDRVATEGTTWSRYENKWVSGQPDYPPDCPDAAPPLGPKSGFGVAWCYERRVKDLLGQPLEPEFGSGNVNPKGAVQYFQGGVMFENPADRQVWALIDDSSWYRSNY